MILKRCWRFRILSKLCVQEMKMERMSLNYVQSITGIGEADFVFPNSLGSLGGILMTWKSSVWKGDLSEMGEFSVTVKL